MSQHARIAVSQHPSTPGGAQFDSFSRSQGPPQKQELHGWSPSSPHSHRWRVPGLSRNLLSSVKKWLENLGEQLCVFTASLLGQRAALDVSRVQIGPPGEAVENNFNAACGLRPLC